MNRKRKFPILISIIICLIVGLGAFCIITSAAGGSYTLQFDNMTLFVGETANAGILNEDLEDNSSKFTLTSSNINVAVGKKGIITAKKAGAATITATKSDTTFKIKVNVVSKNTTSFKITPNTRPLKGGYLKSTAYNDYTKHSLLIRSYLNYFEKAGKGTLSLTKGTYKAANAIYIPSHTTLKFLDGCVIKKIDKVSEEDAAAGTMFTCFAPSTANKWGTYEGYKGVHDVRFLGYGSAKFDMGNLTFSKNVLGICIAHCKNITVSGIRFENLNKGHFIEMDAAYNVTIKNSYFYNHRVKGDISSAAECINLDTPDKNTHGFNNDLSSYDRTPNKKVLITGCTFKKVQRGIGTHQYSQTDTGKNIYHTDITITHNGFYDCINCGLVFVNWKNCRILNNTFNGMGMKCDGTWNEGLSASRQSVMRGMFIKGSSNITIKGNRFKHTYETIRFAPQKNANDRNDEYGYTITYNNLTNSQLNTIANTNYADRTVKSRRMRYYRTANKNGSCNGCKFSDYFVRKK